MSESRFFLKIKETYWPSLTSEQVATRIRALFAIGANMFETGWSEKQPEPEKVIEYREKTVYRYVCSVKGCGYEADSKLALAGHMRHHKLRIEVPITR